MLEPRLSKDVATGRSASITLKLLQPGDSDKCWRCSESDPGRSAHAEQAKAGRQRLPCRVGQQQPGGRAGLIRRCRRAAERQRRAGRPAVQPGTGQALKVSGELGRARAASSGRDAFGQPGQQVEQPELGRERDRRRCRPRLAGGRPDSDPPNAAADSPAGRAAGQPPRSTGDHLAGGSADRAAASPRSAAQRRVDAASACAYLTAKNGFARSSGTDSCRSIALA